MPTRRRHKGGNGKNHKDASQNSVMKQMTTSSPSVQQPPTLSGRAWAHGRLHRLPLGWECSTNQALSPPSTHSCHFLPSPSTPSSSSLSQRQSLPSGRDGHAGGPQHRRGWSAPGKSKDNTLLRCSLHHGTPSSLWK